MGLSIWVYFSVLTNWWYIIIIFFTYITVQKFGVIMFKKKKNLMKIMFIINLIKTVIFWNIIAIENNCFVFKYV